MKTSKHRPQKRTLGLESLESRELLSVAPLTYPVDSTVEYRESDWFEQVSERPTLSLTSEGVIGNEWIIQLKESSLSKLHSVKAAAEYLDDYGVSVIAGMGSAGLLHVRVEGRTAEQQGNTLAKMDCIELFEQNYTLAKKSIASSSDFTQYQWYLDAINVRPAWEQSKGSGVVVAVIDTGIQLDHPDLQDNIWTNPGEIAGNGMDDDGNGFVDDVHGWNLGDNNNNVTGNDHHGTAISGVIGAIGNNLHGIDGIASESTILPIRVSNDNSFTTTDRIIAGINYAIMLKEEYGTNIRAINISIGSVRTSQIYSVCMENAAKADMLLITSAGNEERDNDVKPLDSDQLGYQYNNQYSNVIVVAATNQDDTLSEFSNYGKVSVDLAAPGNTIITTFPLQSNSSLEVQYTGGTSLSAPMVSGAVALLASAHPDWTAAQIKEAILATVDVLPSLEGKEYW